MKITHVVATDAFAGTERYVCDVARRQADRGHDVEVLGGDRRRMSTEIGTMTWAPAPTWWRAAVGLARRGRRDVIHTHLTSAEMAATLTRGIHCGLLVSTRHIAGARGKSALGRLAAPLIGASLDVEIAISTHVARHMGKPPSLVLHNGVAVRPRRYDISSRTVLVAQRLESEKDTRTALAAWACSRLAEDGWELHIAGDGSQREELEAQAAKSCRGVRFLGQVDDLPDRMGQAAIFLATAMSEPLGLSVLEAMAVGLPVAATASGGHLESLPSDWPHLFAAGDAASAAQALRVLAGDDELREDASRILWTRQREYFDVEAHVDRLLQIYASKPATRRGPRA